MTAGELGAERVALILAGRWREALAQHPGWEDEVVYWLAPVRRAPEDASGLRCGKSRKTLRGKGRTRRCSTSVR